jgi:hypothetical protein
LETSLHQQLKALYCPIEEHREVRLGEYRIDGLVDGRLVEIQQSPLGAIRDKVRTLLATHRVLVVKPLAAEKTIFKWDAKKSKVESCRKSPRHEQPWNLFEELVHFVNVFPHERLCLEIVLTEQQEDRVPARKRSRRGKDYRVVDKRLVEVRGVFRVETTDDLWNLLPPLPVEFTTAELAAAMSIPRWIAQKVGYCLRKTGAAETAGKRGNALVYRRIPAVVAVEPQVQAQTRKRAKRSKTAA